MSGFPMRYRTGQCSLGNHPLCSWTTCSCECHRPVQPSAAGVLVVGGQEYLDEAEARRLGALPSVDTEPLVPDDTVPVERLAHWLHGEFGEEAEWHPLPERLKDSWRRSARALMSQLPELFR